MGVGISVTHTHVLLQLNNVMHIILLFILLILIYLQDKLHEDLILLADFCFFIVCES